jgi:hypothetical protein
MTDDSNDSDSIEDITDDAEEIAEDALAIIPSPIYNLYRIEIQNGAVFSGSLAYFEENFFVFPAEATDAEKLMTIEAWSIEQGWSFVVDVLH